MAYDPNRLFRRIKIQLESAPYLSLHQLSQNIKVGRHTITKIVKKESGKTFRDLRCELLLTRARTMFLDGPNRSIKEIAFNLGFGSQRSFARFVRLAAGCSPKRFRTLQNNPANVFNGVPQRSLSQDKTERLNVRSLKTTNGKRISI